MPLFVGNERSHSVRLNGRLRARTSSSMVSETDTVLCMCMVFVLGTEIIIASSSRELCKIGFSLADIETTPSSRKPASSAYSRALIDT